MLYDQQILSKEYRQAVVDHKHLDLLPLIQQVQDLLHDKPHLNHPRHPPAALLGLENDLNGGNANAPLLEGQRRFREQILQARQQITGQDPLNQLNQGQGAQRNPWNPFLNFNTPFQPLGNMGQAMPGPGQQMRIFPQNLPNATNPFAQPVAGQIAMPPGTPLPFRTGTTRLATTDATTPLTTPANGSSTCTGTGTGTGVGTSTYNGNNNRNKKRDRHFFVRGAYLC